MIFIVVYVYAKHILLSLEIKYIEYKISKYLILLNFVKTFIMFYLSYLYLFTYTGVQHDFYIRWCWRHLTVALSASPFYIGVSVVQSLVFCVVFCRYCLFCPVSLDCRLYCLLFYDLRLLVTPSLSSSFFYNWFVFTKRGVM
jgi:hypothetical protein